MWPYLKRGVVTLVGGGVTAAGIALLVLPGPGFIVIAAGLAILATEYAWARKALVVAKQRAEAASATSVSNPWSTAGTLLFGLGMLAVGALFVVTDAADLVGRELFFWSPVIGGTIFVGGIILLTVTVISYREAKRVEVAEQTGQLPPGGPPG